MLKQATGLDEDALAFALLPLAAACARADLSHFNVGAIARGVSGTGTSAATWSSRAQPCSKPFTPSRAPSATRLRGEKALSAITVNYTPAATAVSL